MAYKALTQIDFGGLQLLNTRYQLLATDPSSPVEGQYYWNSSSHALKFYDGTQWNSVGSGSGSVTSVSVVTANGFAGTVATASSTPAITVTTTVTGLLKGNGSAISAAVSGTDYAPATNGTAGQVLTSNGTGGFGTALASSITIAGTATALGGSITLDTITGLSSVGMVKRTAANTLAAAVSGTDYAPAVPGSGVLKGNGSGGFATAVAGTDFASPSTGTSGQIPVVNGSGGWGTSVTLDTDGTLAANSDTRIATQKAVVTYVANAVTSATSFQGAIDASTNPNYPSATKGQAWVISVAGKIGGASGTAVDAGDMIIATAANAGGTQASVGANWAILEHNLVGALLSSNNLSDVASASTARTNLGLGVAATLGLGNGITSSGGNLIVDTTVVARKYAATIGNGSLTSIVVTHNLGTQDVAVSVRDATSNAFVFCDITANSTTQVTLGFAVAPASNAYRVAVVG